MSEWLMVILLAMAPISELRGALPLAYWGFNWPLGASLLVSFIFNALAGLAVFYLLAPVSRFLRARWPAADRFYRGLAAAKMRRYGERAARAGTWGLGVIIALPLPGTGAWTGALLAHLFKLPPRLAVPAIIGGVAAAGLIVSAAVLFSDQLPALLRALLIGKIQP